MVIIGQGGQGVAPSPATPSWLEPQDLYRTGQANLFTQVGPIESIKVGPNQVVKRSPSIALRKAMAPVTNGLDRVAFAIAADQSRHLRPAQAGVIFAR